SAAEFAYNNTQGIPDMERYKVPLLDKLNLAIKTKSRAAINHILSELTQIRTEEKSTQPWMVLGIDRLHPLDTVLAESIRLDSFDSDDLNLFKLLLGNIGLDPRSITT